jgi:hypothetical protein
MDTALSNFRQAIELRCAEPWNGSPRRSATAGRRAGGRLPALLREKLYAI